MKMIRRLCISAFLFVLVMYVCNTGYVKEYSYERGPVTVDTIPNDTINNDTPVATVTYPQCSLCSFNTDFEMSKWSFAVDTFAFCGNVAGAVMLDERKAFTFFGPSACTEDSGLIITAFFDKPFDTVASYVTADRVTMRYYNHTDTGDVFVAYAYTAFYLVIDSYTKASGIMKGAFGGPAVTAGNDVAVLKNGRFEIQF